MAETGKKVADTIREVMEATAPDAPKKNAVAAEPTHLKNDAEDLGPAVVKPTDSNPDASKSTKQVSDKVSKSAQVGSEPSHIKGMKKEETVKSADEKEDAKKETVDAKADDKETSSKEVKKEEKKNNFF